MIAFHGSMHRFNAFDPARIGTGEGTQTRGYGFYFAEAREHALAYARGLDYCRNGKLFMKVSLPLNKRFGGTGNRLLDQALVRHRGNLGELLSEIDNPDRPMRFGYEEEDRQVRALGAQVRQLIADGMHIKPRGYLYTVHIPDSMRILRIDVPHADLPARVADIVLPLFDEAMRWTFYAASRGLCETEAERWVFDWSRAFMRNRGVLEQKLASLGYGGIAFSSEQMSSIFVVWPPELAAIISVEDVSEQVLQGASKK